MNINEAKRILKDNGFSLLKESGTVDAGFVQNLITDIENIPNFYDGYDEPISYTVKPITLNTKLKPEVALAIDIEGVEKPLIIGFAKASFAGCGNYTVFRCRDINDTRVSPIGHSCETLDDAYDCVLTCAAERIKKLANGEIR